LIFSIFFFFSGCRRTPKNKKTANDDSFKTPSLEDFGISSKTLQMLQTGEIFIFSTVARHIFNILVALIPSKSAIDDDIPSGGTSVTTPLGAQTGFSQAAKSPSDSDGKSKKSKGTVPVFLREFLR